MQKYNKFSHHLNILSNASNENLSNEFIISGIYYKFGIQFDLSWKLFKELLTYEGISSYSTGSPREIIKAAYKCYNFIDEDMLIAANQTGFVSRKEHDKSNMFTYRLAKLECLLLMKLR